MSGNGRGKNRSPQSGGADADQPLRELAFMALQCVGDGVRGGRRRKRAVRQKLKKYMRLRCSCVPCRATLIIIYFESIPSVQNALDSSSTSLLCIYAWLVVEPLHLPIIHHLSSSCPHSSFLA